MAVTLTASNALGIQVEASRIWNMDKTQNTRQYSKPVPVVEKLAAMQSLRHLPIMTDGGRCVETKVWYPDLSDIMGGSVYSGATPNPAATCDIGTCASPGSLAKTYTPNVYISHCFSVSDNLCGNDFEFQRQFAVSLNAIMLAIRNELNRRMIVSLNSNAGANVDTAGLATLGWTTLGVNTTIPAAQWASVDILMKMALNAAKNRIQSDFVIVDGTNLWMQSALAPYIGLNDSTRSEGKLFADYKDTYVADIFNLDTAVGTNSTFVVNPGMIGFYNRAKYSKVPQLLDSAKNTQAFSIDDPELRYRFTELNANGVQVNSPVMAPVQYDVIVQRECTGRDATGRLTYETKVEVMFEGAIITAPPGITPNHTTGILKYTKGA